MSDMDFEFEARLELLRAQLAREREGRARAVQRLDLAEKIVQRFMQLNFPVMHGQATAAGMDVIEEADQVLRTLRTGRDLSHAFRRDTDIAASEASAAGAEASEDGEDGEAQAPQAPPTLSPTLTSEAAITALQIIGETADYDVITLRWARRLGLDEAPERKADDLVRMEELREALEEVLDSDELAPHIRRVYVPTMGQLAIFQKQLLVYLTETDGVPEYRARFGKEPIHERTPVGNGHAFIRPQTYPSDECWWWTRALKTMIERGNQSQQSPFTYTVYDPCWGPLPAEFKHRYPDNKERNGEGSEPDLFVVMEPIGGTTVRVVIEFERANYTPGRLKTKIWKNLKHYQAFQGIYYIAPNRDAAARIRTATKKVAADAKDKPGSVTPGLVVVFQGSVLEDAWLPSPAQVDRFNNTPPDKYDHMAGNVYYYKHKG